MCTYKGFLMVYRAGLNSSEGHSVSYYIGLLRLRLSWHLHSLYIPFKIIALS